MKIILKNDLPGDKNIKIKESNAGIFRNLTTLAPNHNYLLKHDPHATYREYFLIMLPDKTKLRVLTSDDFNDFKEISIYQANDVYDWRGVPRNGAPKVPRVLVNPPVNPVVDPAVDSAVNPAVDPAVNPPVNPPVNLPVTAPIPQAGQSRRGKVSNFFYKIGIRL